MTEWIRLKLGGRMEPQENPLAGLVPRMFDLFLQHCERHVSNLINGLGINTTPIRKIRHI